MRFEDATRTNQQGGLDGDADPHHTDQDAENPAVAGGSAVDPTKPGPWVTWQETDTSPVAGQDQIFVSRPEGPGTANCNTVTPAGEADNTGNIPAVGGFCFQQTGIGRVTGGLDPSLNVDPTRNGIEPDIAFTIHYRAVATSDFGTFVGNDETLRTALPPPGSVIASVGRAKVSGRPPASA